MPTWIDVVPDGAAWVVRCQSAQYGRFATQSDAFNAAVAEARNFRELGRKANVRVLRDVITDDCLNLL